MYRASKPLKRETKYVSHRPIVQSKIIPMPSSSPALYLVCDGCSRCMASLVSLSSGQLTDSVTRTRLTSDLAIYHVTLTHRSRHWTFEARFQAISIGMPITHQRTASGKIVSCCFRSDKRQQVLIAINVQDPVLVHQRPFRHASGPDDLSIT